MTSAVEPRLLAALVPRRGPGLAPAAPRRGAAAALGAAHGGHAAGGPRWAPGDGEIQGFLGGFWVDFWFLWDFCGFWVDFYGISMDFGWISRDFGWIFYRFLDGSWMISRTWISMDLNGIWWIAVDLLGHQLEGVGGFLWGFDVWGWPASMVGMAWSWRLVGGLEHQFYFPIYWESHHPNWLSYFSEGWPNHQPVGEKESGSGRWNLRRWASHCNMTSRICRFLWYDTSWMIFRWNANVIWQFGRAICAAHEDMLRLKSLRNPKFFSIVLWIYRIPQSRITKKPWPIHCFGVEPDFVWFTTHWR